MAHTFTNLLTHIVFSTSGRPHSEKTANFHPNFCTISGANRHVTTDLSRRIK